MTKGSIEIQKMINKLIQKGYSIKYSVITGQENEKVLAALKNVDIVVDSLWNESPAGTFPAEAAFCGNVVLIGSYFASSKYKQFTKRNEIPPYCFVTPNKFFDELEKLVSDTNYLLKKGRNIQLHE